MHTHALTVTKGRELQPAGVDLMAAFAEFLRLRVSDGDPSAETVRSYHGEVGRFVAWVVITTLIRAQLSSTIWRPTGATW